MTRLKAAHALMLSASDEARGLAIENEILGEIGRIISSRPEIGEVYAWFGEQLRSPHSLR